MSRIARLETVLKVAKVVARDALGISGVVMVVRGVSGWSIPAAWIVAGLFTLAAVWLSARRDR